MQATMMPDLTVPVSRAPRVSKKRPSTRQVRIDEDLVMQADLIASTLGLSTPEYLSGILRPIVAKDFDKAVAQVKKRKAEQEKDT